MVPVSFCVICDVLLHLVDYTYGNACVIYICDMVYFLCQVGEFKIQGCKECTWKPCILQYRIHIYSLVNHLMDTSKAVSSHNIFAV
jgi:hypothetical protein